MVATSFSKNATEETKKKVIQEYNIGIGGVKKKIKRGLDSSMN